MELCPIQILFYLWPLPFSCFYFHFLYFLDTFRDFLRFLENQEIKKSKETDSQDGRHFETVYIGLLHYIADWSLQEIEITGKVLSTQDHPAVADV